MPASCCDQYGYPYLPESTGWPTETSTIHLFRNNSFNFPYRLSTASHSTSAFGRFRRIRCVFPASLVPCSFRWLRLLCNPERSTPAHNYSGVWERGHTISIISNSRIDQLLRVKLAARFDFGHCKVMSFVALCFYIKSKRAWRGTESANEQATI